MGVRAYVIRLSQISSFFSYCHDKYATLADVVKHCVENLTNHVLRYSWKLLMDDKSGMMKYQTGSHDGIMSFILNGRGKSVHVEDDKVFVCDTDSKRKKAKYTSQRAFTETEEISSLTRPRNKSHKTQPTKS